MQNYIFTIENHQSVTTEDIGGKAQNLFHLQKHGLPVPEFICISAQAFKEGTKGIEDKIDNLLKQCNYNELQSIATTSKQIKSLIISCEISGLISEELNLNMNTMRQWDRFSVRSSATNEDGLKNSFAGQLGTWLNVSTTDIQNKVKACWASAFDTGILTYLHKIDSNPRSNLVSVVIQRMVNAESAGVMFQADPLGGNNKQVIAAGYGLGEGIVADKVETDIYRHDKISGTWSLEINKKKRRLDYHPNGGTKENTIDESLQDIPVLTEEQRTDLLHKSKIISIAYDHYQDIEWSFDKDGKLFILQARPITTIPTGHDRVFDNSNIIESYPGIVLPMTFSLLHLDYYECLKEAYLRFGATKSVIEKRDDIFKNMVGYINGRSYYNISNWYRALLLVPYSKSMIIDSFDKMIGTDGSFEEKLDDKTLSRREKIKISTLFPIKLAINIIRHDKLIKEYFIKTGKIKDQFTRLNIDNTSTDELISHLISTSREFTKLMSIPIINDFFAMIFMPLTKRHLEKSGVDDAEFLLNKLLSNQQIESTKPVNSMNELINLVREDKSLYKILDDILKDPSNNSTDKIYSILLNKRVIVFNKKLKNHIDLYGHRSPKELIMEADTFRENPFHMISIILESSRNNPKPTQSYNQDDAAILKDIMEKTKHPRLLKWFLNKTRKTIAHREATRLDRGLHFSYFRSLLHAIGRKLKDEGIIDDPRDIFYITLHEMDDFRRGCSVNQDIRGLIKFRKNQSKKWKDSDPEEKLFTRGLVYANQFPDKSNLDITQNDLQGTGCSGGEIIAQAKVIINPNEQSDVKDRILVSETTDPGWVFLMTLSAGLISERGSLLSHTAIIGRELGIPTIVGVKNATRAITDGDKICMNGKTGAISINQ